MTAGSEKGHDDWAFAIAGHRYLLECWLASYEMMCLVKRTPKYELTRHESIIRMVFEAFAGDMALVRASGRHFGRDWEYCPRVDEILGSIAKGDNVIEATQRYFNKLRYGVGRDANTKTPSKDNP